MPKLASYGASDPRVARLWQELESSAVRPPPYFLSWAWIENWLACLPSDQRPSLAVMLDGTTPTAACFIGRRSLRRHVVVPSRALYLNTTGVSGYDELCVEHNGLLRGGRSSMSVGALIQQLPQSWDEIFLPAVDQDTLRELGVLDRSRYRIQVEREVASPFVDLELVRGKPGGYLALLSSSTRAQIRRARREVGELTVEIAADDAHATDIYDELVRMHRARWQLRGEAGAFADPWFDDFHRRLIAQRLRHGEIQLMRVRAKDQTIGCLYNLVYRGRTLFYQSGLAQFANPHIKPGFLCHAEAVAHNAASGMAVYDLLGGDARYKQSLSTSEIRLMWLRVQRRLTRFSVEDRLAGFKQTLSEWRHRVADAPLPAA